MLHVNQHNFLDEVCQTFILTITCLFQKYECNIVGFLLSIRHAISTLNLKCDIKCCILNLYKIITYMSVLKQKVSNMTATGTWGVYFLMCSAEQLQRCFGKQTAAITDIPGWAMNWNFSLFVNTSWNDPHGVTSDTCLISLKQQKRIK